MLYPVHTRINGSIHAFEAHETVAKARKALKCQTGGGINFTIKNYDTGRVYDHNGKRLPSKCWGVGA